jgi:hypothetical protein
MPRLVFMPSAVPVLLSEAFAVVDAACEVDMPSSLSTCGRRDVQNTCGCSKAETRWQRDVYVMYAVHRCMQ